MRRIVQRTPVHHNQVGPLADVQAARNIPEVQRLSSPTRRHQQGFARRERRWIVGRALHQQRRQPHFFEHIQVVIARRPIGADAQPHAALEHLLDGRDSARQLEVAGWVVRHGDAVLVQQPDLLRIDMHAVGGDRLRAENAQLCHPLHDLLLERLPAFVRLLPRLQDMDLEQNVELQCQLGARLEDLVRAGVRGMRRHRRHDQRVAQPILDELARVSQALLVAVGIRRGEFHDRLPAHGTQAGLGSGLGNIRLEVVHIGE